jgi:hypothetical protein
MQELQKLAELLNVATKNGSFDLNQTVIINESLIGLQSKLKKLEKLQEEKEEK